ncbi:MAG: DUF2163 domain-containing protein [Pseudomonadota bacterium]
MKTISEAMADTLAGEALTLCLCWRLTRTDGFTLRLTDHDHPVTLPDETYVPAEALRGGRFISTSDLRPGRAAAAGVLSSDAISESDIEDGLWDRTRVDVFRADWKNPDLGTIHIWSGYLSEVTRNQAGVFEAELVSLKADLERLVGRVIQRRCDASLGDARCGLQNVDNETCDQRFETCRDQFGNTQNFRGFPHLPGPDFVLQGPAVSGNDGGKR